MAASIVGSFATLVCDNVFKLNCYVLKYEIHYVLKYGCGLFGGLKDNAQKLQQTLVRFRGILLNEGGKVFKDDRARAWHDRVKAAVDEAERIVEDALDQQSVCHSFSSFICLGTRKRRKLGRTLRSLLLKFETLYDERGNLNFEEIDLALNRETDSNVPKGVVGRDRLKEEIIKVLLSEANNQSGGLKVYAIIGQGGIGKTTFAQLIFNDTCVKDHFKLTIWVWVSQTFQVKKVMDKIIELVSEQKPNFDTLKATQNRLKELLSGKKFLLVLDDIWNENIVEWDQLKLPLNYGATGSCIILTTREFNVASVAGARVHDQVKMPVLSEDECWRVFKEKAYFDENQENGVWLEVIGKQIAKKCGGLPLAAKSLGGSLRSIRDVWEWELVRDVHIWEQPSDILLALKLTLDRLDRHSRNCFTFCCVFPKGYEMDKEELIQLWMANDLIPSDQGLELEDKGNKIFKELVVKSFFQVGSDPEIITMHDLMHDLCLYFRNECFCLEGSDIQIPPQIQHLSIHGSNPSFRTNLLETLSKSHSSLRTCIFLYTPHSEKINFKTLNCLRVLNLSFAGLENLPVSIGNVKDLKYLNLYGNKNLTHLPNSIGDLIKLQTLKLSRCDGLTQLPEGINRLVNLRHLDLSRCEKLTHLPDGIGGLIQLRHLDLSGCEKLTHLPDGIGGLMNLRHLDLSKSDKLIQMPHDIPGLVKIKHVHLQCCHQSRQLPNGLGQLINLPALTLDSFVMGPADGERITELKRVNGLKGELKIYGLENVRDATEATEANLKEKKNLSSLWLIWKSSQGTCRLYESEDVLEALESPQSSDEAEAVLEALQPPESLNKKLVMHGYGGSVFPTWLQFLHNLVEIELSDCIKCERLPPLGQLRHLEVLTIKGMRSLKCIDTEFYGSNSSSGRRTIFPSLVKLVIVDMPKLEEWEDVEIKDSQQTEACPCLKQVEIHRCESLKSLPECLRNLSNLRELEISNCDQLELSSEDFQSLISLEEVELADLPKLTSFPALQHFSKLQELEIKGCKNLMSLGPQGMMQNPTTVLERIKFQDCEQLELSSTDFQHFLKLKDIYLTSLPKLTSLPHLQHLHSLRLLNISKCKNLRILPHCLQNITSLRKLEIEGCNGDLELRCAKDTGEYWPFIKHIPKVIIQAGEKTPPSTPLSKDKGYASTLHLAGEETPPSTPPSKDMGGASIPHLVGEEAPPSTPPSKYMGGVLTPHLAGLQPLRKISKRWII